MWQHVRQQLVKFQEEPMPFLTGSASFIPARSASRMPEREQTHENPERAHTVMMMETFRDYLDDDERTVLDAYIAQINCKDDRLLLIKEVHALRDLIIPLAAESAKCMIVALDNRAADFLENGKFAEGKIQAEDKEALLRASTTNDIQESVFGVLDYYLHKNRNERLELSSLRAMATRNNLGGKIAVLPMHLREQYAIKAMQVYAEREKEKKDRREKLIEGKVQKMDVDTQHSVIKAHKKRERKIHRAEADVITTVEQLEAVLAQCPNYSQQRDIIITHMRAIESRYNLRKVFYAFKGKRLERDELFTQLKDFLVKYFTPGNEIPIPTAMRKDGPKPRKPSKRGRPISKKMGQQKRKNEDCDGWEPPALAKKQRTS